uniref:6-pyruvoyltetrahydropterin synthase n=1 Tax=Caligus rogercresseyi TaxID=217165 RepID=C1BPL3_CALRO|nr:6-pyruvoyl tetrahydrobiopterin synthase [Caligus rogercresseyi]
MTVYLTRREHFCAAHRLHSDSLTSEENQELFGKCNNPNGHGHNYNMEITVSSEPCPKTGFVMNLVDLKELIATHVLRTLDHRNIDLDVPYFAQGKKTSTAENIAIYIWDCLNPHFGDGVSLYEVRLWETEKNSVAYRGGK